MIVKGLILPVCVFVVVLGVGGGGRRVGGWVISRREDWLTDWGEGEGGEVCVRGVGERG